VRWQHPERGTIGPAEFLPFAEQTGMIAHITRWVAENALRQCGAWRAAGLRLHVSMNVSSRDLLERDLPDLLAAAARRHAVPPESIIVEVTESALMEDPQRAQRGDPVVPLPQNAGAGGPGGLLFPRGRSEPGL
jgi:EAL domain-containing protein (putative c-di-GMP-specific phosphodiesterase class I)